MGAKERLRAYLKLKGISQTDFLNSIGASPGYIAAMSKGFGPRYEPMVREKYPDLNIGWILTGDGQMLNGSAPANAYKAGVPTLAIMKITGHKLDSTFLKYIRVSAEENAEILSTHPFFR